MQISKEESARLVLLQGKISYEDYRARGDIFYAIVETLSAAKKNWHDRDNLMAAVKDATGLTDAHDTQIEGFLKAHTRFHSKELQQLLGVMEEFMTTSPRITGRKNDDMFHFHRHIEDNFPHLMPMQYQPPYIKSEPKPMTPGQFQGYVGGHAGMEYDRIMRMRNGTQIKPSHPLREPSADDVRDVDTTAADIAEIFQSETKPPRPRTRRQPKLPADKPKR